MLKHISLNHKTPLVSICIPVYNAEPYLAKSFRSAVDQSYGNWELIIVENCSSDGSRRLVNELVTSADDSRIKVFLNDTHLDMAANMNRALKLAGGDYVKILCADDSIAPECVARQVEALERHPNAVLAGCSRNIIGPDDRTLFVRSSFRRSGIYDGRSVIRKCLWAGTNLIGEPTSVLLRSSILKSMPQFDVAAKYWVDLDLWFRLLMRGDMYFDVGPLAAFRVHGGAATRTFERALAAGFVSFAARVSESMGIRFGLLQRGWLQVKVRMLSVARRLIYGRVTKRVIDQR